MPVLLALCHSIGQGGSSGGGEPTHPLTSLQAHFLPTVDTQDFQPESRSPLWVRPEVLPLSKRGDHAGSVGRSCCCPLSECGGTVWAAFKCTLSYTHTRNPLEPQLISDPYKVQSAESRRWDESGEELEPRSLQPPPPIWLPSIPALSWLSNQWLEAAAGAREEGNLDARDLGQGL